MQMSFTNFSDNNDYGESRCSGISTLLTAVSEFMFIIWVFINRCELKSVWKVTTRYRLVANEYPEINTIKQTL